MGRMKEIFTIERERQMDERADAEYWESLYLHERFQRHAEEQTAKQTTTAKTAEDNGEEGKH